ncbi:uncharacterized protein [Anabrus simplex]|uniref:uncharacterized protein n=1 Tax=Anabrus simplex TaxID=316456 RepID=UPI0035A340F7
MMNLRPLLFLSLVLAAYARECTRPRSAEDCDRIKVKCVVKDPDRCRDENGEYQEKGGFCGKCNICLRYVGVNEKCNASLPGEYTIPICRPPLICTGNDGNCVESCTSYTN